MEDVSIAYQILVGNTTARRLLGKPSCFLEDNFKMNFK
jgi:hypothetical protein